MEKPVLDQMWETYIKIEPPISLKAIQDLIRSRICPLVSRLVSDNVINWYHFLIHSNPSNKDDLNSYFHIRFSLKKNVNPVEILPDYCIKEWTKKTGSLKKISGIDNSLLRNEEIEEAWRIIGEQSEWILNMINIHREDAEIPLQQIVQFMHFFTNMLGLGHTAILALGGSFFRF